MASSNFTKIPPLTTAQSADLKGVFFHHHEKISCSFAVRSGLDPLELLGRSITIGFVEQYSEDFITYNALVMAVHVGCSELGMESQLLLRLEGEDSEDFFPVSSLTILAVYA
jgi:hypothetical protein